MKYRKFTKLEKKQVQAEILSQALHGEGLYLFENKANADLTLPRPTQSGLRSVGPRAQFQGDNYYMQMVKTGFLKLIKVIQTPEQQKEAVMTAEKLILDQPDMITEQGKIEHVITKTPLQKLNESKPAQKQPAKQPDVLINEDPVADGFMIVE